MLTWFDNLRLGRKLQLLMAAVLVLTVVPAAIYVASFVPTVVRYDESAVARVACSDHVTCGTGPFDAVREAGVLVPEVREADRGGA